MAKNMEGKQQLTFFKVRDLRKKDQFKIDDAYLNGWARYCGIVATAVYTSLCRHAEFNSQKAFPSQEKIAWEHGISVRTVRRGLKKLIGFNIILAERERTRGKFSNYIYTLLDKSEWKQPTSGQKRPMVHQRSKTTGGKVPTKDNTVLRITNNKSMSDEPTDWNLEKEIEKLLTDPKRHIQIIGVWIRSMGLRPENTEQMQSLIKRNLRPARLLNGYKNEDIEETIKVLKNTDYLTKFTLETCLKYIDEIIAQKKKLGPKIIRFEEIIKPDGSRVMRPIYK